MNKKVLSALVTVVVVAALAAGGYAIFHKSPKPKTSTTTSTTNSSSSAPAVNNSVVITKNGSGVGQYLADPSGRPLYTFNGDTTGKSNCTSSCLATWPAYLDTGATTGLPSNIGIIFRSDNGKKQYTYKGLPLYYFISDSSAGQVTGNGVAGFSVAKP